MTATASDSDEKVKDRDSLTSGTRTTDDARMPLNEGKENFFYNAGSKKYWPRNTCRLCCNKSFVTRKNYDLDE